MKKSIVPLTLILGLTCAAQAGFTPIPINPSSFNHDPVVEATAPAPLNVAVNVTVDGGTNKTGNTWYEKGYNTGNLATGLPVAGSTVSTNNHTFIMPPDYHTNNAAMVGHHNGGKTPLFPTNSLVLATPTALQGISFLSGSGNNTVTVGYTVHYDGGLGEESGTFSSYDWFNNSASPVIIQPASRVSLDGGVQNVGEANAAKLYAADKLLGENVAKVTSIDFYFINANGNTNNNGRTAILAVSGSTDGGATYNIPLVVSGFSYDIVVEADAPPTTGYSVAAGSTLTNNITTSMDGGLSKAGSVWFEKGYYSPFPNQGIPAAGSTFNSATLDGTSYTMPSTYVGNCAVVLASNVPSATITLATPGSYGALSFLCATANGDGFIPCVINFQDGSKETNAIFVPDWFNRALPWSYLVFGRVAALNRTVNNSGERYVNPWASPELGSFEFRGGPLPQGRLFDAVVNVTNSTGTITSIDLSFTNGVITRVASIFAVSGTPANNVMPIFGYQGTTTPGQPRNASVNGVTQYKLWEGTNNVVLSVTNIAGTGPINYQWKKAPRGGGLHDYLYSIDYGTFANVTDGGRVSGATTSALVISNATIADSADYLVVASNPYGAVTSLVATVMILTTNQSLLVGAPAGDIISLYTADNFSPPAESAPQASDRVAQKWLSFGLLNNVLPFLGPVGYTVTPVSGASIVTSMRFVTANDSSTRDPLDYTLEGSNDGATWSRITGGLLKGTLSLPTGRNGTGTTPINALSQNCVEVDFANAIGYKSYRVTITNNYDYKGTTPMQIGEIELLGTLVPNPPVWVRQPEPAATVFVGATPHFTVQASGYPPAKYQWYTNNFAGIIPGATNATLAVPNVQLSDSGTTYGCRAINTFQTISSSQVTLTVIPAPTQPYPVAVINDGAVGYWRLNETPDDTAGNNGKLTHDYRGAYDGYYSNTVIAVDGYNQAADTDKAATFGTLFTANSYVAEIRDLTFVQSTNATAAFSVEAWVNGAAQTVDAAIVTKGYNGALNVGTGTGTEQFVLDVLGTPRAFRFLVRDAAGNGHVAQSTVVPNDLISGLPTWHHLVGVCDQPNGKVLLYVDGLLAGTGTIGANVGIIDQPLPMTIGARKSGGSTEYDNQWNGTIDDVAIYGTALSASQVLNHFYAAQRPPIITLQPTNQTTADNVPVTFASAAYGPGSVGYQWYISDGFAPMTLLAGQNSANYTFTTTPGVSMNYYQVVATNAYGSTTSAVAQLTVVSGPPSFLVDLPISDTFLQGHVIQLKVSPGGTAPFTYQWQKNDVNIVDDYRTYGSQSNVLTIGYAAFTDSGNYKVLVTGQGTASSVVDAVVVTNILSPLINAAGTGWSLQGTPPISTDRLELTSGAGNTTRSAFLTAKQNVGSFNYSFVYQTVSGAGGADGITFCIQNSAATALGGGGGALGYGTITPSVALGLNIYDPNTRGIRLLQGGTVTTPFAAISPILIGGNANPVQINLNYNGSVLAASFKDLVTSSTFTTNFIVDIPTIVGGTSAFVGFTGADGGTASTQIVTNFTILPPVTSMKVAQSGGNTIISWPASTGAYLLSSPTLTSPTWTRSTDQFRVVGNDAVVTVTPAAGNRFFRLQLFP